MDYFKLKRPAGFIHVINLVPGERVHYFGGDALLPGLVEWLNHNCPGWGLLDQKNNEQFIFREEDHARLFQITWQVDE